MIKHLTTVRETQVRSLGWEDPLEKEMATHSSTLAWKTPWTEEPGRLRSMGLQRVGQTERLHIHSNKGFPAASVVKNPLQSRRHRFNPWVRKIPGEGKDIPLQYSCLENPMDRGVRQAAVHVVAKSWTRLSD